MATINDQVDRSSQTFADRAKVWLGIFDDNETVPASQDGKINLETLADRSTALTIRVRNNGAAIPKNTLIHITGWDETNALATVVPADPTTNEFADAFALETIGSNSDGDASSMGDITGVVTTGTSVGATVFAAPSGGWTTTMPTNGHVQAVGKILRVNNSGVIRFQPRPDVEYQALMPDFKPSYYFERYSQIVEQNVIYRAKAAFTSSTSFSAADWEEVVASGGSGGTFDDVANVLDEAYAGGADATGATDSTAAFVAAINGGKKAVVIPPGLYRIEGNIAVSGVSDLLIYGFGNASIVEQFGTGGAGVQPVYNVFEFDNCSNVTIRDIWVRGGLNNDATLGEAATTANEILLYFKFCDDVQILNCRLTHATGHFVDIYDSHNVLMDGCMTRYSPYTGGQGSMAGRADLYATQMSGHIIVTNCHFMTGSKTQLFIPATNETRSMIVSNNVFCQVKDDGTPVDPWDCTVIHNANLQYGSLDNAGVGDRFAGRMVFSNNLCYQAQWDNVYINGEGMTPANNVQHTGARITITGNVLAGAGVRNSGDISLKAALYFAGGRECNIVGNLIIDYYATPIGTTFGGHAIQAYQHHSNSKGRISDNIIANCGGSGVYLAKFSDSWEVTNNTIAMRRDGQYQDLTSADYTLLTTSPYLLFADPVSTTGRTVNVPDSAKEFRIVNMGNVDLTVAGTGDSVTVPTRQACIAQWNGTAGAIDLRLQNRANFGAVHAYSTNVDEVGGHRFDGNTIETDLPYGLFYNAQSSTMTYDKVRMCNNKIVNNYNVVRGSYLGRIGSGIYAASHDVRIESNDIYGFNDGISIAKSLSSRSIEPMIINNYLHTCGWGIDVSNGGSGLTFGIGNRFDNCSNNYRSGGAGMEAMSVNPNGTVVILVEAALSTLVNGAPYIDGDVAICIDTSAGNTDPLMAAHRNGTWRTTATT